MELELVVHAQYQQFFVCDPALLPALLLVVLRASGAVLTLRNVCETEKSCSCLCSPTHRLFWTMVEPIFEKSKLQPRDTNLGAKLEVSRP